MSGRVGTARYIDDHADVAQLVERKLPKLEVAGSRPVVRSFMGKLIYSMGVSADGYVNDADGSIGWTVPSDELHLFHNERVRQLGAHLLGRRLYETMLPWETDPSLSADDIGREFAAIWNPLPKVVFSRSLDRVEGNYRLAESDVAGELAALRETVDADIGIGGPGLAAEATRLGLIDEYQVFALPIALGGGTPFFSGLERQLALELVETRPFPGGVTYLRYLRA
jgi:dihydrofolate reductase